MGCVMFKAAICDDDALSCEIIYQMLTKYQNEHNICFDIDIYNSGARLCNSLNVGEKYDLIFLDIQMPDLNGIEVGRIIRDVLEDMKTSIIYISSEEDYALKLFDNMPIGFLIKPVKYEDVRRKIDRVLKKYGNLAKTFSFYLSKKKFSVDVNKILYFESSGRKMILVTPDEKYEFYDKLTDIVRKINDDNFILVHRSFLVNIKYIKEYRYSEIIMQNDDVIVISQNKRPEVREILQKYNLNIKHL